MSNTSTIREQLTYKAGLQLIFIVIGILITTYYTLPTLQQVDQNITKANVAIEKYLKVEENGIEFAQLKGKIKSNGGFNSVIEIIEENEEDLSQAKKEKDENGKEVPKDANGNIIPEVSKIIKKNGTAPYLEWLQKEVKDLSGDKVKLKEEKAKINTILPTLSPSSSTTSNENTITLRNYIAYIEQNILKKFNILSFSPLGIAGINYTEAQNNEKNPIGSFQIELNFNTSSEEIIKLLEYIKKSGEPYIFKNDYIGNVGEVMSNPLITIDGLSISEYISKGNNKNVTGRLKFSFYIRGSHASDQNFLFDELSKKQKELAKEITDTIDICKKTTTCSNINKVENIQKRFENITSSFSKIYEAKKGNTLEAMYLLTQQIQSIKTIEEEYKSIIK